MLFPSNESEGEKMKAEANGRERTVIQEDESGRKIKADGICCVSCNFKLEHIDCAAASV